MKTLYLVPLFLLLAVAMTGEAEAAKYGTQAGQGHQYNEAGIAGDCIPNNTQDPDATGDGTCDGDQDRDRLQTRDRLQDGTCDQDCDGPLQTRDRDRVHVATQEQIDAVANMQALMERIREAFRKLYGWQ